MGTSNLAQQSTESVFGYNVMISTYLSSAFKDLIFSLACFWWSIGIFYIIDDGTNGCVVNQPLRGLSEYRNSTDEGTISSFCSCTLYSCLY